ncbi:hypothetical protein [Kineosporia mesophila]|uniref:hypothetical protein n=1 Tax=Kineosporia mesophila TaxID=566012 RepID=UPI001E354534|nr:hypothetical protein [Kineosporia mesophila]MCD5352518.1 hypothetical protein [Kineosporia mesophila]
MLEAETPIPISGESVIRLGHHVHEILASGFPGIRPLGGRVRTAGLDGVSPRRS